MQCDNKTVLSKQFKVSRTTITRIQDKKKQTSSINYNNQESLRKKQVDLSMEQRSEVLEHLKNVSLIKN